MKLNRFKFITLIAVAGALALTSCAKDQNGQATGPVNLSTVPTVVQESPAGQVGVDLNMAAQVAMANFAQVKAGNSDYLWSLGNMLNAYSTIAKTKTDVDALVTQWTKSGGQPLASRIGDLFGASTGSSVDRMKALADAAFLAAGASSAP